MARRNSDFLHKSGIEIIFYNYRPITLLTTIYKIRTAIIRNRICHFLNILTNERQCAYNNINPPYVLFMK